MEAALWGRLDVVKFLLTNGANPNLEDRKGRGVYVENSEAESNRRIIAVRLQSYEPVTVGQPSSNSEEARVGRFILEPNSRQHEITYYEHNTTYDIPDEFKAIARLDQGRMFPTVSATSGWRTDFAVEHIIYNHLWMCRVRELCRLIDYDASLVTLRTNEGFLEVRMAAGRQHLHLP